MIRFTPNPLQESPERPEIEYPCTWVYKVIGEDCSLLKDIIVSACSPLPVKISHSHTSSKGKYHSLNAELEVPTEEVRLRIYELLKCSPIVKIVL
jgi:hypothetical protein